MFLMMATGTVMLRLALKLLLVFLIRKPSLVSASSSCYSFYGEEVKDLTSTYTYESIYFYRDGIIGNIRPKVALQILLLLSGDIKQCPGLELKK